MSSYTLENPHLTPSDHCWMVLQDFGPDNGGWGPASMYVSNLGGLGPAVYTGNDPQTIAYLKGLATALHEKTGKPTKLCCFTNRVDVESFE